MDRKSTNSDHIDTIPSMRERMATLEAENAFNRETLTEISGTLKEVVRTQHILANQKDEIDKLVKVTAAAQEDLHTLQQKSIMTEANLQGATKDIDLLQRTVKALEGSVSDNHHFVKTMSKVLTVVVTPVIILFLAQVFGLK